ncbi:hypothetical protein QQ045_007687 [Rhodiola kirilowii]
MEILNDDGSCGGSNNECRIFKETFHGNESCGTTAIIQPQPGKFPNTNVATSSEHSSLLSFKDVLLKNTSNVRGASKGSDERDRNPKRMKSSISEGAHEKTCSENVLNASVLQKESVSALSGNFADSSIGRDTLRVVEYSLYNVSSGSINSIVSNGAVVPSINLSGDQNKVSSLEHNNCEEILVIKQVTSPASQESSATKAVVAIENSNSKSFNKENQEDDELFGGVSLKDARDQLNDRVTRLMEVLGWHVEVRQRDCRTYKEKVYISAEGKRVREFPKLWRLLGRGLSVNNSPGEFTNTGKCWTNLGHYCSDLSKTFARTSAMINPTDTKSKLADIWNILDPFVNLMFIDRKIGVLKKGIAVEALRSIPVDAYVKNNGDLTFEEIIVAPKKNSGNKGKIQPSGSSLAADHAIKGLEKNNPNQTEKMGSEEESNHQKSRNKINECMTASPQVKSRQLRDAKQGGDCELSLFEKTTGMEGSLFKSSLHDVHPSFIIEWGSQHGLAEQIKVADDMPTDDLEDHIAVETSVSHHSNNEGTLLDFSGHNMLQQSDSSPVQTEFLNLSNISPSEDPSMKCEMQNGCEKEIENSINLLHNVVVCWKEHEDLACGEKANVELDAAPNNHLVSGCLDSNFTGPPKEGIFVAPSKQVGGQMADDDILLSAIKKKTKKHGSHSKGGSVSNLKVRNVKRKAKGRGRNRNLQPRSGGKAGKQSESKKCISLGARTSLSWLIDSGVVHQDETISYRMPKSNDVVKNGFLTKDGILCYCCSEVLSVSKFRLHAGAKSPDACSNLYMESGQSYALCQLQAWSAEYSTRKNHKKPTRVEDDDQSDDICGLCGDGGDLICCDNCPATFHPNCLATEIPEGNWYCSSCICGICGEFYTEGLKMRKCSQCEHKYHVACLKEDVMVQGATCSDAWFCSQICHQLYLKLRSRVGVVVPLENGFSSTLLRCFHDDEKSPHPPMSDTYKEDCNTKLAVALTIMEECFLSMVDFRTGINMIPHMVYNFGSNFPRLDFNGFYAVILERDDVVLCVATLRIHGSSTAEIPLVATCSKHRRKGMCRLLMGSIEEMLRGLMIEKIVMSAVPEQVPTWVNGFGFQAVEDEEKATYKTLNLVVLPGTILLYKPLLTSHPREQRPATLQLSNWHIMSAEPDKNKSTGEDPGSRIVVK